MEEDRKWGTGSHVLKEGRNEETKRRLWSSWGGCGMKGWTIATRLNCCAKQKTPLRTNGRADRQRHTPTHSCKLRLGMGTVAHVVAAINKPLFVTVVNVMAG